VAILAGAHLVVNETVEDLKARFRRLRCGAAANGFSWEPFEIASTAERDWGREAVATNFTDGRLDAFVARNAGSDIEVGGLSLEEIFLSIVSAPGARP
jgi:hypothetical protein